MSHSTPPSVHDDGQPEEIFKSAANLVVKVAIVTAVVVGILIALAVMVAPDGPPIGRSDMSEKAIAARIQKVGTLSFGAVAAAGSGPRSGEDLYKGRCAGCHTAGVLGSPKLGDKAAWAARLALGYEALVSAALKGKNGMPAQGGGDYSDEDVARAVVYLANSAGANFKEGGAK